MCVGATACAASTGDLTGTQYGSDRSGGSISFMARDGADHGTLWVATSAGRIFVTHNADAVDPSTVTWHRIDNSLTGGSPTRFPSGIYVDPADTSHAWISYSGYNAATPTTLGHVFDVTEGGPADGSGTFTNLNVEQRYVGVPDAELRRRPPGQRHRPGRQAQDAVRRDGLRRPARGQRRSHLARHRRDAALRGHAPRDPTLVARSDVRRRLAVQVADLRGDALEGHLADEPGRLGHAVMR